MKYKTDEERREADRKRKREWARRNKSNVIVKTYSELTENMTEEEYRGFREKRNNQLKNWRQK